MCLPPPIDQSRRVDRPADKRGLCKRDKCVNNCALSVKITQRITGLLYKNGYTWWIRLILHYPHMPIGKVHGYRLLFVCYFWLFLRLPISPAKIKLAASKFERWFIGVLGTEYPILGNFASQKTNIGRIGAYPNLQTWADWRQSDVLFIAQWARESHAALEMRLSWNRPACGHGSACVDRGQSPLTHLFRCRQAAHSGN